MLPGITAAVLPQAPVPAPLPIPIVPDPHGCLLCPRPPCASGVIQGQGTMNRPCATMGARRLQSDPRTLHFLMMPQSGTARPLPASFRAAVGAPPARGRLPVNGSCNRRSGLRGGPACYDLSSTSQQEDYLPPGSARGLDEFLGSGTVSPDPAVRDACDGRRAVRPADEQAVNAADRATGRWPARYRQACGGGGTCRPAYGPDGRTRPPPGLRRRHACTPGRRPRRKRCRRNGAGHYGAGNGAS